MSQTRKQEGQASGYEGVTAMFRFFGGQGRERLIGSKI
jgi:hypothetical protein